MTSPPSSLPSPTPSSGSSQTKPQTFSSITAFQRSNTSSTSSASPSTNSQASHTTEGAPTPDDTPSESFPDDAQQTPQPPSAGGAAVGFQPQTSPFLPQVTASPPPHPPPYVPPVQHAMPPDPIHTLSLSGQPGSVWTPGWRPGPPGPGHSYAHPQGYRGAPNGSLTHQLPPNPYEASRQSMSSTPGAGPLPNGARSGSQPGEPRDRRRDRHRDEDGRERDEEEVISTIFVVGFPDDMSEREFQNVFTFAPGFEAATLKFPSGAARREPAATAVLLAELQHLAANQNNMGGGSMPLMNPDHPEQPMEESFAGMNFGTQSSTASNTPSAAMSLTPSAPTGATLGGAAIPPSVPPRRQTIGFARFKTRADALAARDHLQGRRIDPLTGATLKAEMAKKNLHTKRGVGGDDLVGMLLRSGRLSQLVSQQAQAQALSAAAAAGLVQPNAMPGAGPNMPPPGHSGTAQSAKEAWDAWPAPAQANSEPKGEKAGVNSANSNTSGSPPLSVKSPNSRPTDSKALLALAEEADALEGWNVSSVNMVSMPLDYTGSSGPTRSAGGGGSVSSPLGPTTPSLHGPQHSGLAYSGYGQHGVYSSGLSFGSGEQSSAVDPRSLGIGGNLNPADQNPPINTLYIGNLPAISPPTHPPNFLEESLRSLFHRRPGFKRMSFRQKINGPMCFVEFEDIPYATQAMRELYGNTLNGLVKGGIRLSYSKNSLGQRGNSHQQGMSSNMFGGIAHTVALAGMSSGPSSQLPPGSQSYGSAPMPIGPPSATANSNSDLRRPSDAPSSLSPNAQPFTAPLPTSPNSRGFFSPTDARPSVSGASDRQGGNPSSALPPVKTDAAGAFNSFAPSSAPQGGFSPVSSPIRTPASLGWVSSSSGTGGGSSAFGGFDAFGLPPHGLSSLNGAASAWGQANSPNPS